MTPLRVTEGGASATLGFFSVRSLFGAPLSATSGAPIATRSVFIAGEATSECFYGTAHGAWLEGERAARQTLAALGQADPA